MALHLYGTPGQSRFDFMWDILIRKAHAYILLVAAHRPGEFRYARRIVTFMNQRVNVPMIIGLTHMDCQGAWQPENIVSTLWYREHKNPPPIVVVDANDRASVAQALIALMQHLMESAPAPQSR
jgi:signal recognition particle receptor subunit beta